MNKKISFPFAVIIIVVCAVLLVGLIVWQYQIFPEIFWEIPLTRKTVKEVTITTDKTEYEQGETIEITVKNALDKDIVYITTCIVEPYRVQNFLNDKWLDFVEIESSPRCLAKEPQFTYEKVKAGQSVEFSWDQKRILPDFGWASSGRYRVLFSYKESETSEELKTIYSNEFTIKEKKQEGYNPVIRCGGGACKCMKEKECEPYGGTYIIPTEYEECSVNSDNKMCCCPGV